MTDSKKIFIDTAPFIYYIERNRQFYDATKQIFKSGYEKKFQFFTSTITVEEYCVYHFKNHTLEYIENFKKFINQIKIIVIPISFEIALKAAELRSKYKHIKGMDAMQLAAGIEARCEKFITNDKQLLQISEIAVSVL